MQCMLYCLNREQQRRRGILLSGQAEGAQRGDQGREEQSSMKGVYLGVDNYGSEEVCRENIASFRYRFSVKGPQTQSDEILLRIAADEGDPAPWPEGCILQNKLKEGSCYKLTVRGDLLEEAEEISGCPDGADGEEAKDGKTASAAAQGEEGSILTELRPDVCGTPGERTLKNFLTNALMPAGRTLYIFGGAWDWQDEGSGPQSVTIGVPDEWLLFFAQQDADYTYKDIDGDESKRDPAHSCYPFGRFNEYYYAGADCSGFVGWTLYNTFRTEDGEEGFVSSAGSLAAMLAGNGWGTLLEKEEPPMPGDVMSIAGHVWISLGTCSDGSTVIVHSTPSFSRTGQPGGGVQVSAVGTEADCEAMSIAREYMKTRCPRWYERYDAVLKDPADYLDCSKGGHFRWDLSGKEDGLTDPEGIFAMDPQQLLDELL